jgi:hypothetical protein
MRRPLVQRHVLGSFPRSRPQRAGDNFVRAVAVPALVLAAVAQQRGAQEEAECRGELCAHAHPAARRTADGLYMTASGKRSRPCSSRCCHARTPTHTDAHGRTRNLPCCCRCRNGVPLCWLLPCWRGRLECGSRAQRLQRRVADRCPSGQRLQAGTPTAPQPCLRSAQHARLCAVRGQQGLSSPSCHSPG